MAELASKQRCLYYWAPIPTKALFSCPSVGHLRRSFKHSFSRHMEPPNL